MDDREFNSSYCDYQSEIFKEQPSQNDFFDPNSDRQMINIDSDDDEAQQYLHNQVQSPPLQSNQKTPSIFMENESSLRIKNHQTSSQSSNGMMVQRQNKQNQSQTSAQIRITNQNSKFNQSKISNEPSQKNSKKQPPCSLVPQPMGKQVNRPHHVQMNSDQCNPKNSRSNNDEYGRQKELEMHILHAQQLTAIINSSNMNLTPQKEHPVPISPSQHPMLSNSTSGVNLVSTKQGNMIFQQNSKLSEMRQSRSAYHYSDSKPTVVYNEFKYFTSGNEINRDNCKNYVPINQAHANFTRKSDAIVFNQQQTLTNEITPSCENLVAKGIFDVSSPKNSVSAASTNHALRANNSIRKHLFFGENRSQNQGHQESQNSASYLEMPPQQTQYEIKIKELQDHIQTLEEELKSSQQRNQDMQKRINLNQVVRDKSFIQSFDKNASRQNNAIKHLSDTEDSLLISEKKNFKRQSNNNSKNNGPSQNTSSIVDVKIRPVNNLKANVNGNQLSFYPRKNSQMSTAQQCLGTNQLEVQQPTNDAYTEHPQAMLMEYQVQNYQLSEQDCDGQFEQPNQIENEESQEDQGDHEEEECDGCERLKQLVFQAKEAIDDLKAEIEDWREICAEKDREIRQMHHKLYNDLIGIEKRTAFKDEVQLKEYDPSRPANLEENEGKRIKNFIQQNKKKIKSRSKSRHQHSGRRSNINSNSKKSTLKNMREVLSIQDSEFFEVEDQGIQTSFIAPIQQDMNNVALRNVTQTRISHPIENKYGNNTSISQNMSPDKQQVDQQNELLIEEVAQLKQKNQTQEAEINQLRTMMDRMTKQCETFVTLTQRVKRKTKKSQQQIFGIDEIKKSVELVSPIESYSILEKIQEWKREEGLVDPTLPQEESLPTNIPRPLKLIMEITQEELGGSNCGVPTTSNQVPNILSDKINGMTQQSKSSQSQMNEFRNYIKQEQENLKRQQEQKLKDLQKQQQEYLQFLKGQQQHAS